MIISYRLQQKKKAARSRGDTRMAIDKEKVDIAKTKSRCVDKLFIVMIFPR
jgi:hypothetical protein